ncbi:MULTISPECIES: DUF917 domain-containing protein [unclassified Shimia]|uniref:DUF917 domain-containing protein n=1 Tax=unclassified Shimia TaxID=2630038 RepID=UPI0031040DEC
MTKDRWQLGEEDILALEIGAGILGTGGGGNPYLVKLRALEILRAGHKMEIISLASLRDDAKIVPLGGIGAPIVGIERIKEGSEGVRALRALEAHLGFRADALACQEIGGANSMEPLIIAAQAGIPVVDCDGMGRAFPEMQMTTYSIYGHCSTPSAMADPHGNIVVFDQAITEVFHERMARAVVVAQGGSSTLALAPMSGAFTKRAAIPNSYSNAIALGRAILDAQSAGEDPVTAARACTGAKLAFKGKITDLKREISGGFVRGGLTIEGFENWQGQTGDIELQNEFLVFRRNGKTEVIVPDLVVVLDADDGTPLSTDMLRYGQRIAVLSIPANPLLKTPEALEVIGPKAFGYATSS